MAAIDELRRNYRTSVVLCTATQPALRKVDGTIVDAGKKSVGFDIDDGRELAPDPAALFTALKRVEVERLPAPVDDGVVAKRFSDQPQMLCINSRAHARALFERIRDLPGAVQAKALAETNETMRIEAASGDVVQRGGGRSMPSS
jgi:CRISPR-associated endonuclease/helicase Cas3